MGTEKKWLLIDYNDLVASMPIRLNHYDKEHGNIHYVYGIELVMETAEWLANNKRVEAIPVEWIKGWIDRRIEPEDHYYFNSLIDEWEKENDKTH